MQRRQLLRTGLPRDRIFVQERRKQLQWRAHPPRRALHQPTSHYGTTLLHPLFLLHTQGDTGGRHHSCRHLHGGGEGGEAHVEVEE